MNPSVCPKVLYAAPGAGLGHLVRACAVSLHLRKEGIETRIVTNSCFAEGLRRLTGCAIDFIPSTRWVRDIPVYAAAAKPRLVVLDTFPWGLRGEWKERGGMDLRFVTIARRLNVRSYLEAARLEWDLSSSQLERIIVAEPLADDHLALLESGESELLPLPGRIRFPAEEFPTVVPEPLAVHLLQDRVWLVVHTGPREEVLVLLQRAQEDMKKGGGGVVAAVILHPPDDVECPVFELFPASHLYGAAFRVVTGAGYGSLADMAPWPPDKHLCVPFQRRYDDQAARLDGLDAGAEDGTPHACEILMAAL